MQRNVMLALVAVALVALATPQVAEATCMSTPAVDEFFRVVVRKGENEKNLFGARRVFLTAFG